MKNSTAEGDQPQRLVWVQGQGQKHAVPLPLTHKLQWQVQQQLVCRVAVIHTLTHESTNDDLDPMSVAAQQCWRPHGCRAAVAAAVACDAHRMRLLLFIVLPVTYLVTVQVP